MIFKYYFEIRIIMTWMLPTGYLSSIQDLHYIVSISFVEHCIDI